MAVNKSEGLTARLLSNDFLKLYVCENPQIEAECLNSAVEFCDVLISFHGIAILVEVKEFNTKEGHSEINTWLRKKIRKGRSQLTERFKYLQGKHRVFDKKTKETIAASSWESVMMVIVFDRDDVENYSYPRAFPDDERFCGVNIFSMKDFRTATELIPTPLDFFSYLEKRYFSLKEGTHLLPVVQTPKGVHWLQGADLTDETILIHDYLLNKSKYHDGNIGPAKAIIRSAQHLYKQNADKELLQLFSCIDMEVAQEMVDIRDDLIQRTEENALAWNGQFVQSGFDDGKIAIAIAYSKKRSVTVLKFNDLKASLKDAASERGIEVIYAMIFHDGDFLKSKKSNPRIAQTSCQRL